MTRILVIAGTDCSGGAGLGRDVAAATLMQCDVAPVVAAVTVQTDQALSQVHHVPPGFIGSQIKAAMAQPAPAAVKIGMLGTSEAVEGAAEALAPLARPIVLDPVLATSSGGMLQTPKSLAPLLQIASVVTPNLSEAATLTGTPLATNFDQITRQADLLRALGAKAVLIKGGHATGPTCTDHLFSEAAHHAFSSPRLNVSKRGTGCTLSTMIACQLAKNATLASACVTAIAHLRRWLTD